jgi:drug/metabolite transporter (DMT)-like permease
MSQPNRTLGLILGIVAVTMFGGSLPGTRAAVAFFDPWFVTVARAAIGGVLAAATLAVQRPRVPRQHLGRLALISLTLVIGFPALMAIATVTVPASHAAVILGLQPLATMIGAVPIAGERPSPLFWLLSVIGAGLVVAFALRDGSIEVATGDLWLIAAVSLTGLGYTLSGVLSRTMSGVEVIAWALVIALPVSLVATFLMWPANAAAAPASAWIGLIYVGAVSQFIGYGFWNVALAIGGVARVGQVQLLQVFAAIAFSALFLGETITPEMLAFAIAVVAVVALGRRAAIATKAS